MKLLGDFTVLLLANIVSGAVIKQETSDARGYARRSLGVQESSLCIDSKGTDYPYICNSIPMCLYCPGKTVGTVPASCATVGSSGVKCLQERQSFDGLWHCEYGSDKMKLNSSKSGKRSDISTFCETTAQVTQQNYSEPYGTANGQCPVPSQSKLGENAPSFDSQMLEAHNYFRCLHGSPSMTTSSAMKTRATTAVENSAATGELNTHLRRREFGHGFGLTKIWYDEIVDYNYDDYTQSTGVVGHFTQVVWADSVNLGCAHTVDIDSDTQIACEYDPPGNLATVAAHQENVKRPI
ncbi:uncharacterized protein [Ptychodera flava]|uniref:uncharacterized protein n=1 Tax=Ptychodera flava TaxID=63121 RepID=UPI00396A7F2C